MMTDKPNEFIYDLVNLGSVGRRGGTRVANVGDSKETIKNNLDKIFTKKYNKHIKVGDRVKFLQYNEYYEGYSEYTGIVYALHPYGFGNFLVVEVNAVLDYMLMGVYSSQVELIESHNE